MTTTMAKTNKRTTIPLAIAALAAATVGALPACGDLKNNTIPIDLISYRPDGSLVLFTTAGISVYDGSLRNEINHIPLDALAVPPFIGGFTYMLSADGSVAAVAYGEAGMNGRVALYRIPEGDLLKTFELADEPGYDMSLSPDGKLLCAFYGGNNFEVRMVDAVSGTQLWTSPVAGHFPVWSSDGTTLFVTNGDPLARADEHHSLDALDANTGAVKWSTDLHTANISGLALVGNGTSLTGPALGPYPGPCDLPGDCPPFYPFWSSADGTLTRQLPGVPRTTNVGSNPRGFAGFACNATDTCAFRMAEFTLVPTDPDWQTSFVRLYKTDGTELGRLPMVPDAASSNGSMAISPDGKFITIADDFHGGAKVFSVDDGTIVASRTFPTETF